MKPEFLKKLKKRIKTDEGFRSWVYDDATGERIRSGYRCLGTPTFGFGFTYITRDEADAVLQLKLKRIIEVDLLAFSKDLPYLNEARLLVYISMIYQMGAEGLGGFTEMRKAVRNRDWQRAYEEMLDSKWAKEDTPNRSKRLANIMLTGSIDEEHTDSKPEDYHGF